MALHKHFSYSGGSTEIAIDLEWWMCIKKIGIRATPTH
jgi:hypothetical protein